MLRIYTVRRICRGQRKGLNVKARSAITESRTLQVLSFRVDIARPHQGCTHHSLALAPHIVSAVGRTISWMPLTSVATLQSGFVAVQSSASLELAVA
jgi:hypothetical protein